MTRKLTRNYPVSVVALFIAVPTLLIAVVLAQTTGPGRPSEKTTAVLAPMGTSASAQAQRLSSPWSGAGSSPVVRPHTKRRGAGPTDQNPPLFLPAVTYDTGGTNPVSVAVADVSGDGKPDLVVDNENIPGEGSLGVLLGNGDGTFKPVVTYDSGGSSQAGTSVAIADFNGDGTPDLAVANSATGTVGVLLGTGDGTFHPAVPTGLCCFSIYWPGAVAATNVNQDGKTDLLVVDATYVSSVGVLLGNGDGSFGSGSWYYPNGLGTCSIAGADVNGDGITDVVVATWYVGYGDTAHGTVAVLLGNGDGSLQPAVSYTLGANGYSVAVGDLNGDGRPDLAVANHYSGSEGAVEVFLGNGDGTFQSAFTYDSGGLAASSVALADVNGDGKPDIVVANALSDSVATLLGNGDGTFQPAVTYGSGGSFPDSVTVTDVNGDRMPDVIVANNRSHNLGVLLHAGVTPTTATLASSLNPAAPNKVVTYTATVISQDGGTVTGTVVFQDGGSTIATVSVANNQAAYSTTYKKGGVHTITALYSGDTTYSGSASAPLKEYVEIYASKTALATSGSPSKVGQPVTFTATVTSASGTIPDGELVTFYDGTTLLGSVAIAGGTAAYTTSSLSAKTHYIKATYTGDTVFKPSTGRITQVVVKYPTTTALSSSPNPSAYGQPVTFTATVTLTGPYPLTSKVKFWDGPIGIGSATLSGGVAKLTKSYLAVGTHPITAQYLGDTANAKSTSSVVEQVVQ